MALDIMAAFTNEPPELDFIWPGFLAGTVGALFAPGATGKSFFALEAAMSIACSVAGGDLVGLAPAHRWAARVPRLALRMAARSIWPSFRRIWILSALVHGKRPCWIWRARQGLLLPDIVC